MAVIFTRKHTGVKYEIRSAGRSIRLYTDGVLHTQFHPDKRVTGGVWDLLALPAVALTTVKRVLLLGVGGGAAIHMLRDWCPGVHITGVELNPVHLQLAKKYFHIQGRDLTLVTGDARTFVEDYRGEPFDMVIEDVFGGNDGEPDRTFVADSRWCKALGKLVSKQGVLVINTLGNKQLRDTAFLSDRSTSQQWASHLSLTLPTYANVVGAFYRQTVTPADLNRAIRVSPDRARQERAGQLRFQIKSRSVARFA